ncbi:four-carbon acid sugar kinase family protein [soil metagenome]
MPRIGAVADDYTGATDLATTLVSRGYRTVLAFDVPDVADLDAEHADAVVIGLKTRSAPVDEAVAASVAALRLLRRLGCTRFYDKYCATFDSTPAGNIGPILDALMDELGVQQSVVVLPFPEAGRTVYQGHLFVAGTPLHETSMRDHPLTPMTDSRILRLLTPQTRRSVTEIRHDVVAAGRDAIAHQLRNTPESISVVDAIYRDDLDAIAGAVADLPLVSGGAGLAASFEAATGDRMAGELKAESGFCAVLAGSASLETQHQIAEAQRSLPSRKLSASALRADFAAEIADLTRWARQHWQERPDRAVLLYSVGEPGDVDLNEYPNGENMATLTEHALAACATAFVAHGMRRLIVAGGETSGSVTRALGIRTFAVGHPISPGVAWATAQDNRGHDLAILLKSGSLGTPDIFRVAWSALP